MRKQLCITICAFLLFTVYANAQQGKQEEYLIKGITKGIESGIIRMLSDSGNAVLDSSIITQGQFTMQGKIGLPERRLFTIIPGNWSFRAFVEDTTIALIVDTVGAQHYGKENNTWALIWEIEETGSKLSDVYAKYKNETNQSYYISAYSDLSKKFNAVRKNKDDASKVQGEMDSVQKLLLSSQKLWIENYIRQNPASIAGVFLFHEFYQSSPDISLNYLQSTIDKFSGIATASIYYKLLVDQVVKLINMQAGSVAPDFSLLKRDKTSFALSSTRGRYTMIDFWASWCVPCRKAIPNWKRIYSEYSKKGFSIVSVSGDRNWNDWIRAIDKERMPWTQVIDEFPAKGEPSMVSTLYGVPSLPFYVLLDKDGKVILSTGNENVLRNKIQEIFQ